MTKLNPITTTGPFTRMRREDVTQIVWHAMAVRSNPLNSTRLRADAAKIFDAAADSLAYQNDTTKHVVMLPGAFSIRNCFSDMVSELLGRLPEQVFEEYPGTVQLAKHMANWLDNSQQYCTDQRLDGWNALRGLIEKLEELGPRTTRIAGGQMRTIREIQDAIVKSFIHVDNALDAYEWRRERLMDADEQEVAI